MLTEIIPDRPCTQVWKLIKKSIPQVRDQISKNPGNGNSTSIWDDKIMGTTPLNQYQNLRGLKDWLEEKGTTSLYSISEWEQNIWIAWRVQFLLDRLKNQWKELKHLLARVSPINKESQDSYIWDPIRGKFTVKLGYNFMKKYHNYEYWNLWTAAWKNEFSPIIKKFAWTLLKGKILTAENLRKKGFQGPSICVMCQREEESIQHLFLKCIIARQCWKKIISPLEMNIHTFE